MKKILLITIFLVLGTNAYSKIIEFEKCYFNEYKKQTFKSFKEFNENSIITNKTLLNFENNPKVFPVHLIRGKRKDFKISGEVADSYEYFNFPYENIIFRISTKEMKVEQLYVFSQKVFDNKKKLEKKLYKIRSKLEKENKEIPFSLENAIFFTSNRKKLQSDIYEIKNFYNDNIVFEYLSPLNNEVMTTYDLNMKTGLITINDYPRKKFFIQCSKKGSKQGYLDYWWAVILIIAITFFIFTQSGKRLKQIRRK